ICEIECPYCSKWRIYICPHSFSKECCDHKQVINRSILPKLSDDGNGQERQQMLPVLEPLNLTISHRLNLQNLIKKEELKRRKKRKEQLICLICVRDTKVQLQEILLT
ncbi:Hypothetical protein FKW44_024898, partial [Caligus rogercresseyi]